MFTPVTSYKFHYYKQYVKDGTCVDVYCTRNICIMRIQTWTSRCSKKPCEDQECHEVVDFEEMYDSCREKSSKWIKGKELLMEKLSVQVPHIFFY